MIRPARATTALAVTLLAQSVPAATLTTLEPRAFGYRLGDIIERRLLLQGPTPLPDNALPRPGRRGAFELRSVSVERRRDAAGPVAEIRLRYQLFAAPAEPLALPLPALTLALGDTALAAPEYRVYVSPLVPPGFAGDSALGELRPDLAAPPIDATATRTRLAGFAAATLLLALWLAWRQFGDLLSARRRGPFASAWQELRRHDPGPDAAPRALRRLHRAFDAAAGTTLFAEGLDAFLAARPEFEPQRAAIADFFARSRRVFFTAGGQPEAADLSAVLALAAACRAIERSRR